MQRRKLNALLCGLALGASIFLPGQVSAEIRTVEADGVYQMGDGMAENQAIAKERAKAEAVRSAGEQAAAYVESDTVVSNGKVTKDDIRLMTAAVLELKDVKYTPVVVGESIQFKCHVVAVVDTDKVQEKLQEDNLILKASLKQYEAENDRLRKEMEQLKQEYSSSQSKSALNDKVLENDREFEANEFLKKATYFYGTKDYTKSIENLEKALMLNPKDAYLYNSLIAGGYGLLGNFKKSIEYLEKAIILSSVKDISYGSKDEIILKTLYVQLINTYAIIGNTEKATHYSKEFVKYLENKMKVTSLLTEDYVYLGKAYYALGNTKKAIGYLEKAVELDQQNMEAYGYLGDCYEKSGEKNKALDYYKKMININPNDPRGYGKIGSLYLTLGEYKKVIEYSERGLELDSESALLCINMGLAYISSGEYNTSIKYLERVTHTETPFKAVAYVWMGVVYEEMDNVKKANECYSKAEKLSPGIKKQMLS